VFSRPGSLLLKGKKKKRETVSRALNKKERGRRPADPTSSLSPEGEKKKRKVTNKPNFGKKHGLKGKRKRRKKRGVSTLARLPWPAKALLLLTVSDGKKTRLGSRAERTLILGKPRQKGGFYLLRGEKEELGGMAPLSRKRKKRRRGEDAPLESRRRSFFIFPAVGGKKKRGLLFFLEKKKKKKRVLRTERPLGLPLGGREKKKGKGLPLIKGWAYRRKKKKKGQWRRLVGGALVRKGGEKEAPFAVKTADYALRKERIREKLTRGNRA